jgi:hypothetical protein
MKQIQLTSERSRRRVISAEIGIMPVKEQVDVEGRRLALSNLEKVLYSEDEFAKAQVIDYPHQGGEAATAPFRKATVTMFRFPDGVRGKAFYEKDAPKYTPSWVHTTEVPRQAGGKPIRYARDIPNSRRKVSSHSRCWGTYPHSIQRPVLCRVPVPPSAIMCGTATNREPFG